MANDVDAIASSRFRAATLVGALGVLGGATLILFATFFSAGKLLLLPYAFVVVMTGVILKGCAIPRYGIRWAVGTSAFVIASTALYVFILATASGGAPPTFTGHLWRFAVIIMIGAAIHAAVARVTE